MKTIAKLAMLALAIGAASAAQAQAYRCEANGKVTYQDEPCKGGRVIDAETLRANTAVATRVAQAQPAQSQITIIGGPGACPTPQEVRNIATTESSNYIRDMHEEREFLRDEIKLASSCDSRHRYTPKDWRDLWSLHSFQTRMDPAERAKARREAYDIHRRARRM